MTAIITDIVDASSGSATIAAMIDTLPKVTGTSQLVGVIHIGSGVRFFQMQY